NTSFRIEFFADNTCHRSGFGEGQTFLGAATVTTDGNCVADFTGANHVVIQAGLAAGQVVTATASRLDSAGNRTDTSEFSQCVAVTVVTPPCSFSINPTSQNFPAGSLEFGG